METSLREKEELKAAEHQAALQRMRLAEELAKQDAVLEKIRRQIEQTEQSNSEVHLSRVNVQNAADAYTSRRLDDLTRSFQRLKSDSNLKDTLHFESQGQKSSALAGLVRKASTMISDTGYKSVLKDLLMQDDKETMFALENMERDGGAALRNVLQCRVLEQNRAETVRKIQDMDADRRANQMSATNASLNPANYLRDMEDKVKQEKISKKLQRLNMTQGQGQASNFASLGSSSGLKLGGNGSSSTTGFQPSMFQAPPPPPPSAMVGATPPPFTPSSSSNSGSDNSSANSLAALSRESLAQIQELLNKTQQQQRHQQQQQQQQQQQHSYQQQPQQQQRHHQVGIEHQEQKVSIPASMFMNLQGLNSNNISQSSSTGMGSQQHNMTSNLNFNSGSNTTMNAQETLAALQKIISQQQAQLHETQSRLNNSHLNAGGLKAPPSISSVESGSVGISSSSNGAGSNTNGINNSGNVNTPFPVPPIPPAAQSRQMNNTKLNGVSTGGSSSSASNSSNLNSLSGLGSIHFGAASASRAGGGDMGSKRSRPESMQKFTSFRDTNRTRMEDLTRDLGSQGISNSNAWNDTNLLNSLQQQLRAAGSTGLNGLTLDPQRLGLSSFATAQPPSMSSSVPSASRMVSSASSSSSSSSNSASTNVTSAQALLASKALQQQQQQQQQLQMQMQMQQSNVDDEDEDEDEDDDDSNDLGQDLPRPDIAVNTREYVRSEKPSATPRRWTDAEDELLRKAVERHQKKNWKAIAEEVPGRSHVQCLQRWKKALDPQVVKGHWTAEEDQRLLMLAAQNPKNWGHVAREIEGRNAKQCRERYTNHLDPSIKKGGWTAEEDRIIVEKQKEHGNRWAVISKYLPGRTENSVKIRFKSILRQNKKSAASSSSSPSSSA